MNAASNRSPDPFLLVGSVLAHTYRIDGVVGSGAHGVLYSARHLRLPGRCAVKLLPPLAPERRDALLLFLGGCCGLCHPHLLPPTDAVVLPDGALLLAGPLLEGEDLQNRVALHGKLSQSEGLVVARQAAAALSALHHRALVHGNLGARNVFLHRYDDVAIDHALGGSKGAQGVRLLDLGLHLCDAGPNPTRPSAAAADDQRALALLILEYVADLSLAQRRVLERAQAALAPVRYPSIQEFWQAFEAASEKDLDLDPGAAPAGGLRAASAQTALVPRGKGKGQEQGKDTEQRRETFLVPRASSGRAAAPLPMTGADAARGTPAESRRRLLLLTAGVVLAVAAGVGAGTLVRDRGPHPHAQELRPVAVALPPAAPKPPAPPTPAPTPTTDPAEPSAADADGEQVSLRFLMSPSSAEATVNGLPVPAGNVLRVARQDTALRVLVRAEGYLPYRSEVVPSEDRALNIALLPVDRAGGEPPAHRKKHHRKGR